MVWKAGNTGNHELDHCRNPLSLDNGLEVKVAAVAPFKGAVAIRFRWTMVWKPHHFLLDGVRAKVAIRFRWTMVWKYRHPSRYPHSKRSRNPLSLDNGLEAGIHCYGSKFQFQRRNPLSLDNGLEVNSPQVILIPVISRNPLSLDNGLEVVLR